MMISQNPIPHLNHLNPTYIAHHQNQNRLFLLLTYLYIHRHHHQPQIPRCLHVHPIQIFKMYPTQFPQPHRRTNYHNRNTTHRLVNQRTSHSTPPPQLKYQNIPSLNTPCNDQPNILVGSGTPKPCSHLHHGSKQSRSNNSHQTTRHTLLK